MSFSIGHVYGRANLLHWVYVLERVRMGAYFWDFILVIYFGWEYESPIQFLWEASDFFFIGFLDLYPIHHSIHFWCDLSPCFDAGWPLLTFLSLCLLLSLSYSLISPYLIWFLYFLILFDVWLGFSIHMLFLLIWYVHSFIITFHVGILRSATHDVFYALHLMHEGYGDYIIRIFEPSFLSFLSPYYLSLRYVPCLKTTIRLWLHTLYLTAHTWAILEIGWRLFLIAWWMKSYDIIYTGAYLSY